MNVLLVNGSPHTNGCTYTALEEVAKTLNTEGIETQIFQIGTKPLAGCIACKSCAKTGRCVFSDCVNDFLDIAKDADGFVFGSPVHYSAASGAITSFMDRAFYTDLQAGRKSFYLKPAAAVVSARRAGTTAAFDQLNKYFTISEMPIIAFRYWNMVHGATPEDVKKDLEDCRPCVCLQGIWHGS
ncbi:Iron-sulfur flavoprotein [Pelotomaculum sp. FP]|nr:Iron-sulfur flavoprotein [Pelotomaculum sp. FP]